MRILYLSRCLPAPRSGHGGAECAFELLAALAEHHDVSLLCYADASDGEGPAALERLGVDVDCVPYGRSPGARDLHAAAAGLLRALARGVPFAAAKYDQRRFRRRLRERLRELEPDVLHADSSALAPCLREGAPGTRVLALVDLGARRAATRARAGGLAARGLGALCQPLWRRYERRALALADAVVAFTPEDAAFASRWRGAPRVGVVAPATPMPDPTTPPPPRDPERLAFAASFDQAPNRRALGALLAHVLPAVREVRPGATLWVAGRRLPERWRRRIGRTPGARFAGFVPDVDAFLGAASVFVAPLDSGSGLKIKVARALACGTPAVTSRLGAEGIGLGPEDGLFVAEDPAGHAARCLALLADPEGTRLLGERARAGVRARLGRGAAAAALGDVYAGLRAGSARSQPSSANPRPQSGHSVAPASTSAPQAGQPSASCQPVSASAGRSGS